MLQVVLASALLHACIIVSRVRHIWAGRMDLLLMNLVQDIF